MSAGRGRVSTPEHDQMVPPGGAYARAIQTETTIVQLMEIQRSIGRLESDVSSLRRDGELQGRKLDGISDKVDGLVALKWKVFGAAAVIGVLCSVCGAVAFKAIDYYSAKAAALQQPPVTQPQVALSPPVATAAAPEHPPGGSQAQGGR